MKLEMKKSFTKREKILLGVLGAICLVAVYFYAFFLPVQSETQELITQRESLESEILVQTAKAQKMASMEKELEKLEDEGAAKTPSYDNLKALTAFLNTVTADVTGYNMSFKTEQSEEDASIVRRVATIQFTASSYAKAKKVLDELCESPYRCLMCDVCVTQSSSKDDTATSKGINNGSVQVGLTVTFYERIGAASEEESHEEDSTLVENAVKGAEILSDRTEAIENKVNNET